LKGGGGGWVVKKKTSWEHKQHGFKDIDTTEKREREG